MQQQLRNNRTVGLVTMLQKQRMQQEEELRRTRKKLDALLRTKKGEIPLRLVVDNEFPTRKQNDGPWAA